MMMHASKNSHQLRGPRGCSQHRADGARARAALQGQARARVTAAAASSNQPAVVITGASSGIGKSTALLMASKGWRVYAGVRRTADGEALQQAQQQQQQAGGSIQPVIIDVKQADTIAAAQQQVRQDLQQSRSRLRGLVNNAGKVTLAPLEHMPIEVFEDQMQVNLVGVLRVTQAFLPLLRGEGQEASVPASGPPTSRIVNISSQSGTVAYPLFGAYSASKFGLEAISDCLRYELQGQGIDVVCLQAGPIKSDIWSRANTTSREVLSSQPPSMGKLYDDLISKITKASQQAEDKGASCEEMAELIATTLTVDKPRSRYMFGKSASVQITARRLLPDRIWDKLLLNGLKKFD